jgi:hypothetical protein
MYPLGWRMLVRVVYKKIFNGSPYMDYILTHLHVNRSELTDAYTGTPAIINKYVEMCLCLLDAGPLRKGDEDHRSPKQ